MTLKHARLARAENLSPEIRKEIGIQEGLIIIETRNPELKEKIIALGDGGIRDYLLTLGDFQDIEIEE